MDSFITLKFERKLLKEAFMHAKNASSSKYHVLKEYLRNLADYQENNEIETSLLHITGTNRIDDFISKNK